MSELRTSTFWDLHLHGVAGIDFMHATEEQMVFACQTLGQNGVGFFAPTLLTSTLSLLNDACKRWGVFIQKTRRRGYLAKSFATPVGLHLEGPFLNPKHAGAHPKASLRLPNLSLMKKLIAISGETISIVTIAPELKGANSLIRWLARRGIRVQLGHSSATSAQANQATRCGASGVTHLFNAMRFHHRDLGLVGEFLENKTVTAELITDCAHVDIAQVRWIHLAGAKRLYAVSDGCSAISAPSARANQACRLSLGDIEVERLGKIAVTKRSKTMAGGATFLTEHPHIIYNALIARGAQLADAKRLCRVMLPMFFRLQSMLFSRIESNTGSKPKNLFSLHGFQFQDIDI